jgi:hypothetical protein
MKLVKSFMFAVCLLIAPGLLLAKGDVKGKIVDAENNEVLPGASVVVKGTNWGTAANSQGEYVIKNLPNGTYTIEASFIGYAPVQQEITVSNGEVSADFSLAISVLLGDELYVVSNRAKERETPVAFSNVTKETMEATLGSQDIPMVLNTTPSVYATMQGGGAGDARVNVRGFDQRNTAIMINGVPVNDMENGWVYWSNWDGVGDATSSIQIQRGLSAVNLAVPSIGGTMNILTDPTALGRSGKLKQEFGSDGLLKTTAAFNSGMLNDRFAFSGVVVRKTGDGLIDATWTDAWAYYFAASYSINRNNRLELYALGAPQRHGQNLYKQNIGAYSHAFASKLIEKGEYDQAALGKFREAGRFYNENWAPVSPSYTAQQAVEDNRFNRFNKGFINERENFFHKPQVNLNWFSSLSNRLSLYNIAYYSGGRGGGTGTLGSLRWNYSGPSRIADWDATIARNAANADGSRGILRNSRNNQWTIGDIMKLEYRTSDALKLTGGVDWRTAEIDHYREVRDLLGGAYYRSTASDFWSEEEQKRGLGDKVNYDFTNTVDWLGFFGQGEYKKGRVTAYGTAGYSAIKYTYVNHFKDDGTGNELRTESDRIGGYQLKGGASYSFNPNTQVFANAGVVSKVSIFDNVINDRDGTKATDPKNEKFISFELGFNVRAMDGKFNTSISAYNTTWKDRAKSIGYRNQDGSEGLVFLTGLNTLHQGIEIETQFQPDRYARFEAAISVANWKHTDDVSGLYKDYGDESGTPDQQYNFFVNGLKVGDAPQTQVVLGASFFPTKGMRAQFVYKYYARHFADWDPFSRTTEDRTQSWELPTANIVDFHASYDLPFKFGVFKPQAFLHIFNLFDTLYIQDATDNSRFNGFDKDHDADDAEVFLGLPRLINLGFNINF